MISLNSNVRNTKQMKEQHPKYLLLSNFNKDIDNKEKKHLI